MYQSWRKNLRQIALMVSLAVSCGFWQGHCQPAAKQDQQPRTPELAVKPQVLAFYEEGWGGIYGGSLPRLKAVGKQVDLVSPVWLGLKADGTINWDKTNPEAVRFFRQTKLKFLVLVTAGRNSSAILADKGRRNNAMRSMVAYCQKSEAAGVCLDFEYINPAFKRKFRKFAAALKKALAGRKLFLAVFPYVDWEEPTKEAYDYRRLGQIGDGVVVMTYDQHRPQDAPGPVAARGWAKANLDFLLARIAPHKLWLGVAGYGYRWQKGRRKAVALPAWYCRKLAVKKGRRDTFNEAAGNDCLQYTEKGNEYIVWWESARGLREKWELAVKYNLAGVALWRLGYEDKEFWEKSQGTLP
jgi:spore germination protein